MQAFSGYIKNGKAIPLDGSLPDGRKAIVIVLYEPLPETDEQDKIYATSKHINESESSPKECETNAKS